MVPSFFIYAPGRAHSLGGASPLQARQGELLAERQGCPPRGFGMNRQKAADGIAGVVKYVKPCGVKRPVLHSS
jgi:hypothetical protein